MRTQIWIWACAILLTTACKQEPIIDTSPAGMIVNAAVEAHGGDAYNEAFFLYEFRDKTYIFDYENGKYAYERVFKHEKGNVIRDVLTNDNFKRTIDGKNVSLSEERYSAYSESVNSVHYFAFLPFFLKDKAVQKEIVGEETIKGQLYDKIKVEFNQEGGGTDYNDVYMYWIRKEGHTMDYLAYSYNNPDDVGVRFRAAYNPRVIGDIRFQDYINFKHDPETPVSELGSLYNQDALTELSRIELRNIRALERIEE